MDILSNIDGNNSNFSYLLLGAIAMKLIDLAGDFLNPHHDDVMQSKMVDMIGDDLRNSINHINDSLLEIRQMLKERDDEK